MGDRLTDYGRILKQAETIVREAGEILKEYHERPTEIDWKGVDDPVTAADRAVNAFLVRELNRAFPGDAVLSEEMKDDLSRLRHERVWCVDPLDGTKEFIARNGEFSIMVGLAVEGRAVLGVVYQPILDLLYSGIPGRGLQGQGPSGGGRAAGERCGTTGTDGTGGESIPPEPDPGPDQDGPGRNQGAHLRLGGLEVRADRQGRGRSLPPSRAGHQGVGHLRPGGHPGRCRGPDDRLLGKTPRLQPPDVRRRTGLVASNGRCHDLGHPPDGAGPGRGGNSSGDRLDREKAQAHGSGCKGRRLSARSKPTSLYRF